jgi:hypothetical protein
MERQIEYNKVVDYLAKELGVNPFQLQKSLKKTKALKGIIVENTGYLVAKVNNPGSYIDSCTGRIPIGMYLLTTVEGKNRKHAAIVYSHEITKNGTPKKLVSTSPITKKDLKDIVVDENDWMKEQYAEHFIKNSH